MTSTKLLRSCLDSCFYNIFGCFSGFFSVSCYVSPKISYLCCLQKDQINTDLLFLKYFISTLLNSFVTLYNSNILGQFLHISITSCNRNILDNGGIGEKTSHGIISSLSCKLKVRTSAYLHRRIDGSTTISFSL